MNHRFELGCTSEVDHNMYDGHDGLIVLNLLIFGEAGTAIRMQ